MTWWRQKKTERENLCYNEREEKKKKHSFIALPIAFSLKTYDKHTHACTHRTGHGRTQTPKARRSQMHYISNSVFNGCSSEESLWCPSNFFCMCVCVCVWVERVCVCVSARGLTQLFHVAAMLMSGGDAEAWERWLSSAKPIIHSHLNIYTSAGMTRCSCQRARKQWTHAPTGTRVHAHLCARKESSHRPLHPQTTTHWHTQADPGETNPLSAGMLSLHQIDKRSRGFSFQSCNTLVNCNHCASFYAVDREHKPAVKHNIYFPQPN